MAKKFVTLDRLATFLDQIKSLIPTVNNSTITIKQAGTQKGTFTLNQSGNTTIELTDANTTYSAATTSANGLMSSSDKSKLDGITAGATKVTVDTALSSSSTNPVQNKVINTALAGKAASSHTHTKSDVGLGNVDNTADSTKSVASATKATQDSAGQQINTTYIKGLSVSGQKITYTKGDGTTGTITTQDTNTTYSAATTSANGLMSSTDKSKLDGIAAGANNYTHPTTSGNKHIPSGGSSGQILRWSADGTAVWGADNNTTYSAATTSAAGLMSAADKSKLDGVATGANAYTLPTATSSTLGGVKTGSNITNSSGTISVTKANVVSALAYTPDPEGFLSLASYNGSNGNWYETFGNGTKVFFYGGADVTTYQLPARNCSVLVTRYGTYYATALCILRSSSGHDTQVWVNKSTGEQDPTEAESWEGWTELASVNDVNSAIAGIQSQLDGVEDLLAAI